MANQRQLPSEPIRFIQDCVRGGRVYWTYHVNMRLARRSISRASILAAVETLELVESYPDDKYLPSYLVLGRTNGEALHVLVAADVFGDNVRIVAAYRPDPAEWHPDWKTRRNPSAVWGLVLAKSG